ncbi:Hypothetical predicted protein [Podarcis lilfordi]|uniref:Uncharacterized protein n=1 Tax=Podarcis lilfordi TaxID=74358 RepID=A0AA35PI42_9SAUR|nr:Hypothetical predicted protein [Podarcis lilfordi]
MQCSAQYEEPKLGDIEADDFSVIPNLHHHRRRLLHHLPPQQFPAIHRDNFQRQRGWQECYVVLLNEIQSYEVCVTTRVNGNRHFHSESIG